MPRVLDVLAFLPTRDGAFQRPAVPATLQALPQLSVLFVAVNYATYRDELAAKAARAGISSFFLKFLGFSFEVS